MEKININEPILKWLRNEDDSIYYPINYDIFVEYCELTGFIAFQKNSDRWRLDTLFEECEKNEVYILSVTLIDNNDNIIDEFNR